MDPSYTTYWKTDRDINEIAQYIETTLSGISPNRIVSITHSMATPGTAWYSVLIVIRKTA